MDSMVALPESCMDLLSKEIIAIAMAVDSNNNLSILGKMDLQ